MRKWRFINVLCGFCFLGTSITIAAPVEYWQKDATSATGTGATLNEALGTNSLSSGSKFILNENVTTWTAPLLIGGDGVTTQISIESAGNTTPTYSITGGGSVSGTEVYNRILSLDGNVTLNSNVIYENGYVYHNVTNDQPWEVQGVGAAISSKGNLTLSGNNIFRNNEAPRTEQMHFTGYGAAIAANGDLTISGTNEFIGNSAQMAGGAIFGLQNVSIEGNYKFIDNTSLHDDAYTYGGAISATNLKINGNAGSIFENNWAYEGGAIWAGQFTNADNYVNSFRLSGENIFKENKANWQGGAIYIHGATDAKITGTNQFIENWSNYGGAILTCSDLEISGKNTFTENNVTRNGGAICVNSDLGGPYSVTFSGDGSEAIFTGNKADTRNRGYKGNDIYNATGSVNFQDKGTYSFDGGMYTKELNLSTGAKVTLKAGAITEVGTTTVTGGPTLDTNTLLEVELADATVFQTNSLVVSGSFHMVDYGYSGKETPIAVGEGIDFMDNSTLKISFDENLALEEGKKYTLFTSTTGATLGENMIYEYLGTNVAKEELNVFVEGMNIVMQVGKLPDMNEVPEPATWVTLLLGIGGILYVRRRK